MRRRDDFWQHEGDFWRPEETLFRLDRRTRRGSAWAVITVLAVALAAGGATWYWFHLRTGSQAAPATAWPVAPVPAVARPPSPALALPPLDASDKVVRDLVVQLSSRPALARWLMTDDLARHFVGAVVDIAHGGSPARHVEFLRPKARFRVIGSGSRTFTDPTSYRRYALVTETFVSLDTRDAARLYHQLEPLFDQAYHEMGFADSSFTGELTRAMRSLLAVEIPSRPPALVPSDSGASNYAFADPALEALSPAEKQLLRMGPENARRVQKKLAELLPLIAR